MDNNTRELTKRSNKIYERKEQTFSKTTFGTCEWHVEDKGRFL